MKILLALNLLFFSLPAYGHDWYTGLRNKYGMICCNKYDFKPVVAWQDNEGIWHAWYPNKDGSFTEWVIPDWAILDDKLNQEPFQAHLAIYGNEVRCFFRKRSGG